MNDELIRIQVDAALRYVNRTSESYVLDLRSCRFFSRMLRLRVRTI